MTTKTIVVCDLCDGPKDDRARTDETERVGWLRIDIRDCDGRVDQLDVCPQHAKSFTPFLKRYAR